MSLVIIVRDVEIDNHECEVCHQDVIEKKVNHEETIEITIMGTSYTHSQIIGITSAVYSYVEANLETISRES